jgi:hypothetical protein
MFLCELTERADGRLTVEILYEMSYP